MCVLYSSLSSLHIHAHLQSSVKRPRKKNENRLCYIESTNLFLTANSMKRSMLYLYFPDETFSQFLRLVIIYYKFNKMNQTLIVVNLKSISCSISVLYRLVFDLKTIRVILWQICPLMDNIWEKPFQFWREIWIPVSAALSYYNCIWDEKT